MLMKSIIWHLNINGNEHKVELKHFSSSGKMEIYIDDVLAQKKRFRIFNIDRVYPFEIDKAKVEIVIYDYISIYKNLDLYDIKFDCFVDGISVKTGLSRPNKQEKILIKKDLENKDWELEFEKGFKAFIIFSVKRSIIYGLISSILLTFILIIEAKSYIFNFYRELKFFIIQFIIFYIFFNISLINNWRYNNKKYNIKQKMFK